MTVAAPAARASARYPSALDALKSVEGLRYARILGSRIHWDAFTSTTAHRSSTVMPSASLARTSRACASVAGR